MGRLVCGEDCDADICAPVRGAPLDTLLTELGETAVDVVKIDVSGHECGALAGAARLLASAPRVVIVETSPRASAKCVQDVAAAHGYRIERDAENQSTVLLKD